MIFWPAPFATFSASTIEVGIVEGSQPANIFSQDVPRTSLSNVPRTSPIDPIWPSRGRPDLTSWSRPEITSRGRLNLTFKGRPWEVDLGRPNDVLRTSRRRSSKYVFGTMWKLIRSIDQIYLKTIQHSRCTENTVALLKWSIFREIS